MRRVTYHLHPTFPERERSVDRTSMNLNCQLVIWTWGLFRVEATILDKRGQTFVLSHDLSYDRELDDGVSYGYVA